MSTAAIGWTAAAGLGAVALVLLAGLLLSRRRRRRLQARFGPEYDRVLLAHGGDARRARRDLIRRERRIGALRLRAIDDVSWERYSARWSALQERFVDAPAQAVIDADELLDAMLREQGYPDEDRELALTLYQNRALAGYRRARNAAGRARRGEATTEELRECFVHARGSFELLAHQSRFTTGRRA
ncbi:hypothetical protein, partial [Streptacidiphilus albus]|uniref:hypothetical protein n=1 Tax=Streptacidiphilus albus TaxID=105425 RepID=UPI00054BB756